MLLYMDVGSYNLVNGCICWNILSCKVSMQSYISWWLCARIVGSDWSFWIKDRSVLSTASFTESFVWIAAKKCCNLSSLTGAKNGRFITVSVVRDSTLRCDAYTCAVILLLSMYRERCLNLQWTICQIVSTKDVGYNFGMCCDDITGVHRPPRTKPKLELPEWKVGFGGHRDLGWMVG